MSDHIQFKVEALDIKAMRYYTPGDYEVDKDEALLRVTVTTMPYVSEMAVALHEIVEATLCRVAGITEKEVFDFDQMWNEEQGHLYGEEPGADLRAPYRDQHLKAEEIERLFVEAAGMDWQEHCQNVEGSM